MKKILKNLRANSTQGRKLLFSRIYSQNSWGDSLSRSGTGSNWDSTQNIREWIPKLLSEYKIESVLDAPCGDRLWSQDLFLGVEYCGIDIVPQMIDQLKKESRPNEKYLIADLIEDNLPVADLIFSRDLFIHLSNKHVMSTLLNFKKTGARYLLASNYFEHENFDQITGGFRPVNLNLYPYLLPKPLIVCPDLDISVEGFQDKSIALYELQKWNPS